MKTNKLYLAHVARILFSLIFIFSSLSKLQDLTSFELALKSFNILPHFIISFTVYFIPIIELLLSLFLLLNIKTNLALYLISILLASFTAVIVTKLIEGTVAYCGCFGEIFDNKIELSTLFRNIVLLIAGVFLFVFYEKINEASVIDENIDSTKRKIVISNFLNRMGVIAKSLLLFFLLIQLVVLIMQNREMAIRINSLMNINKNVLQEGDKVKPIVALDSDFNRVELFRSNYLNKMPALYLFSNDCVLCTINMPTWIALEQKLILKDIITVTILIDSLKNLNEDFPKEFKKNLLQCNSQEFMKDFRANYTPQLILINQNKEVIKVITGLIDPFNVISLMKKINE